ncbi:uncharacterized protein LOC122291051 [Carya illinoinensis]|uniref:uncharacterized protein LOC122291051 n=1 Tax=Carya illinoinensis TaxID=32201 RepID=UPI001C719792|nr:uncharacterized protein LOC122291051 [Carya illinoinensis]
MQQLVSIIHQALVILGRPFLAISNALINCQSGVLKLTFGNMTLEMNVFKACKMPSGCDDSDVHVVDMVYDFDVLELLSVFDSESASEDGFPEVDRIRWVVDRDNWVSSAIRWIISSQLALKQEAELLKVLRHHRGDARPVHDAQRRLNPTMKEVVKNEVLKLLAVGIIYPIPDSKWCRALHGSQTLRIALSLTRCQSIRQPRTSHRALWAIKQINFSLNAAKGLRKLQISKFDEARREAHENSDLVKEREGLA